MTLGHDEPLERQMRTHAKRMVSLAGSIGAGVALLSLTTTEVAAQATLSGCYVPNSGTVYRIKAADLPTACHSKNHVEFTWSLQGPQGLTGPVGPTGPQGPAGPAGGLPASGIQVVRVASEQIGVGLFSSVSAPCPAGTLAITGGFEDVQTPRIRVFRSTPVITAGKPTGWSVGFENQSVIPLNVFAIVVCAPAQ